jgi:hypothetical protein
MPNEEQALVLLPSTCPWATFRSRDWVLDVQARVKRAEKKHASGSTTVAQSELKRSLLADWGQSRGSAYSQQMLSLQAAALNQNKECIRLEIAIRELAQKIFGPGQMRMAANMVLTAGLFLFQCLSLQCNGSLPLTSLCFDPAK